VSGFIQVSTTDRIHRHGPDRAVDSLLHPIEDIASDISQTITGITVTSIYKFPINGRLLRISNSQMDVVAH
jgi:hypothetical protein